MDKESIISYIHLAYGLSRENAIKILEVTKKSINDLLEKSKEAITTENYDDMKFYLHTLKSNFGSLGLKELSNKTIYMELKINQGNHEELKDNLYEIITLWTQISL
ncbi:hypothetical protein JCM13304A_10750 [Desulfothermus okinawensis JCM 13304]